MYAIRSVSRWTAGGATLLFVAWLSGDMALMFSEAFLVRDSGGVRCVIETSATDSLAVAVVSPSQPSDDALASLPAAQRDFSSLPARIVLQSPPEAGGGAPIERLPSAIDGGVHYPVIDGALSTTPFVRATFPRAWVVSGTAIVAEKSVRAPDGTRVSTQSVCRITERDAAQWR